MKKQKTKSKAKPKLKTKIEKKISAIKFEENERNKLVKLYENGGAASLLNDTPSVSMIEPSGAGNRSVIGDSMYNLVSSLGVQGAAKTPSTSFQSPRIYNPRELEHFYAGNGTMRLIIDTWADEMTREWIDLEGDDEEKTITKYLDKLDTQKRFADLIRWGRLMGGALIIMLIDDGRALIDEVDLNNIRKIEALRVVDIGQVFLYPTDYYSDPSSPKFNEAQWYTIRPIFYGVPSEHLMFKVHETRVLKIDGAPMTQYLKRLNRGWMAPETQSYMWDIINLEQAYTYAAESVHEMIVNVFGIKDLAMKLSTATGVQDVKSRMDVINYAKSVINAVVIDAEEEKFDKVMTNVSQIDDLLTKLERKLCASCRIPHGILFGDQRSGLGHGGASDDVSSWYSTIKQRQVQDIFPLLKKLIGYVSLADDCAFQDDIEEVSPSFNALWQYEEKDLVAMKLQQAQADAVYIDRGVLSQEEVRERFVDDTYDFNLQIKSVEAPQNFDQKTIEEIKKKGEEIPISQDMDTAYPTKTSQQ